MDKNTSGPAFPERTDGGYDNHGMTLRDYFAAQIMQAMIIRSGIIIDDEEIRYVVKDAFLVSDYMIQERDK